MRVRIEVFIQKVKSRMPSVLSVGWLLIVSKSQWFPVYTCPTTQNSE